MQRFAHKKKGVYSIFKAIYIYIFTPCKDGLFKAKGSAV